MSNLKVDGIVTKSDDTDLSITAHGSGKVDIETGFKVSGTAGVPIADLRTSSGTAGSGTFLRGDGTWAAAGGGGKILQVVTATSSTQTDINVTSYTDISGATGNITPAHASNKILILCQLSGTSYNTSNHVYTKLLRDSTDISIYGVYNPHPSSGGYWTGHYHGMSFIDSPNTTSQITYKMQGRLYESAQWRVNFASTNGLCFSLLEIDGT